MSHQICFKLPLMCMMVFSMIVGREHDHNRLYLCVDMDCSVPISEAEGMNHYSAPTADGLSFRRQSMILILGKPSDGISDFWIGKIGDKVGLVPTNLVRELRVRNKDPKYKQSLSHVLKVLERPEKLQVEEEKSQSLKNLAQDQHQLSEFKLSPDPVSVSSTEQNVTGQVLLTSEDSKLADVHESLPSSPNSKTDTEPESEKVTVLHEPVPETVDPAFENSDDSGSMLPEVNQTPMQETTASQEIFTLQNTSTDSNIIGTNPPPAESPVELAAETKRSDTLQQHDTASEIHTPAATVTDSSPKPIPVQPRSGPTQDLDADSKESNQQQVPPVSTQETNPPNDNSETDERREQTDAVTNTTVSPTENTEGMKQKLTLVDKDKPAGNTTIPETDTKKPDVNQEQEHQRPVENSENIVNKSSDKTANENSENTVNESSEKTVNENSENVNQKMDNENFEDSSDKNFEDNSNDEAEDIENENSGNTANENSGNTVSDTENSENTVGVGDTENSENTVGVGDTENSENTVGVGDTENSENTVGVGDTENSEITVKENSDDTVNKIQSDIIEETNDQPVPSEQIVQQSKINEEVQPSSQEINSTKVGTAHPVTVNSNAEALDIHPNNDAIASDVAKHQEPAEAIKQVEVVSEPETNQNRWKEEKLPSNVNVVDVNIELHNDSISGEVPADVDLRKIEVTEKNTGSEAELIEESKGADDVEVDESKPNHVQNSSKVEVKSDKLRAEAVPNAESQEHSKEEANNLSETADHVHIPAENSYPPSSPPTSVPVSVPEAIIEERPSTFHEPHEHAPDDHRHDDHHNENHHNHDHHQPHDSHHHEENHSHDKKDVHLGDSQHNDHHHDYHDLQNIAENHHHDHHDHENEEHHLDHQNNQEHHLHDNYDHQNNTDPHHDHHDHQNTADHHREYHHHHHHHHHHPSEDKELEQPHVEVHVHPPKINPLLEHVQPDGRTEHQKCDSSEHDFHQTSDLPISNYSLKTSFLTAIRHLGSVLLGFLPEHMQDTILDVNDALIFTGIIALTLISICVPYLFIEAYFSVRPFKKKVTDLNKTLWKVSTAYENQQEEFDTFKQKALAYDEDKKEQERLETELFLVKQIEAKLKSENLTLKKRINKDVKVAEELEGLITSTINERDAIVGERDKLKAGLTSLQSKYQEVSEQLESLRTDDAGVRMDLELLTHTNETLELRGVALEKEIGELRQKLNLEIELRRNLQSQNEALTVEKNSSAEELADLKSVLHKYEDTVNTLNDEISAKENELIALKDTLGEDSPLVDIAEVTGKLMMAERQTSSLQARVESITLQNASLTRDLDKMKENLSTLDAEKAQAETRLQVLEAYFKEKEEELRRVVEKHEAEKEMRGKDKDELVTMVEERNETVHDLNDRIEKLKKEFEETKLAHRTEIRALESKGHETWLSLCQSERKAQEARKESELLRQKLTALVKAKEADTQNGVDRRGSNGEVPYIFSELELEDIPPPLPDEPSLPSYFGLGDFEPPAPLGDFEPPAPLGDDDEEEMNEIFRRRNHHHMNGNAHEPQRPAPLGQMSPNYSDDADLSPIRGIGGRAEYSDGSSSPSPPEGEGSEGSRESYMNGPLTSSRRRQPLSASSPYEHGFNL